MEPAYEQPPIVPLRPQMPKAIKVLWLVGGIIFVVAGLLFLFSVFRIMLLMSGIIQDLSRGPT